MKRTLIQSLACWIIFSFSVVITADFWRNSNVASIAIVEIEPKKGAEKSADSKNDLKEDLKGKFQNPTIALSYASIIALTRKVQQEASLPNPYLRLPDLPPEIA